MSDAGTTDDKTALTGQQIHDEGLDGWRKVLNKLVVRFETGDFNTGAALVAQDRRGRRRGQPPPRRRPALPAPDGLAAEPRRRRDHPARRPAGAQDQRAGRGGRRERRPTTRLTSSSSRWTRPTTRRSRRSRRRSSATTPSPTTTSSTRPTARPRVWFQKTDSDAPDRQRWHLDVSVPHDVAEARIQAAIDAGGTLVDDSSGPCLLGARGPRRQPACICTWQSRD